MKKPIRRASYMETTAGSTNNGNDAVNNTTAAVTEAINTGVPGAIKGALTKIDAVTAVRALKNTAHLGRTPIMHAAVRGDLELFNEVLREMRSRLTKEELSEALTTITGDSKETLLIAAAKGGNEEVFNVVVKLLHGAILEVTAQRFHYGSDILKASAQHGSSDTFSSVAGILETKLELDQAQEMVSMDNSIEHSILTTSVMNGDGYPSGAWAVVLSRTLPRDEMVKACVASFAYCVKNPSGHPRGLAVLIANGAKASPADLIHLVGAFTLDSLKECFIDAFSWVDNPFIPGMVISVALDEAIPKAPEREGRALLQLKDMVAEYLMEVLERLPQTLREFEGGADGCRLMLEPESVESNPDGLGGPLRLALEGSQFTETFCVAPLVFEYLSRQFVAGLPDMRDTENIICPPDRDDVSSMDEWIGLEHLYNDGLVGYSLLAKHMQGIWLTASGAVGNTANRSKLFKIWGTTILPGAQLVAVGVITRPGSYYKVPAMRLIFDFIVHLTMLVLYTDVVLAAHAGDLTTTEVVLIIYVTAAIIAEVLEMYHGAQEYFRDKWNWLDMISLTILAIGLYIRWWADDDNIATVKVFYAISTPFMFSRFLFFAQVLRRQGLVVEMITNMLGEFVHFGVVMAVIMVGFTVAFIALMVDDTTTFGTVLVSVFNAMLGETGAFDDYDFTFSFWSTLLTVVYLVIMSIIMLNLLIAVLSTEYAKIDERSEYSFRVSKVRMMKLYQRVVDTDLLPPPFNCVQLVIISLSYLVDSIFDLNMRCVVRRAVGVTLFWCVTGPIAVVLGSLLWLISTPKAVVVNWEGTYFGGHSRLSRFLSCSLVFHFYLGGAFFVLLSLWLFSGVVRVLSFFGMPLPSSWGDGRAVSSSTKSTQDAESISVQKMLRQKPGGLGVRETWGHLGDPYSATSPAKGRETQSRLNTGDCIRHLRNDLDVLGETIIGISASVDNLVGSKEGKVIVNRKVDHRDLEGGIEEHLERKAEQLVDRITSRMIEKMSLLEEKMDKLMVEKLE